MLYLLWSIINIGLLIWFVIICFSVFKLVKESLGIPALIVFILGCLSFTKEHITNKETPRSGREEAEIGFQPLESGTFHDIMLSFSYPKDTVDRVRGRIIQSGFVIGHHWDTSNVTFYKNEANVHYLVSGSHDWKLLGLTLYTEPRQFKGVLRQ
ncbi:MAG TPA: hypothetical protein VGN64_15230 [Dyadobacter sp.]|jgi:hypothetical protein|nr:hypothetical protein [Dyadobacter sp.]